MVAGLRFSAAFGLADDHQIDRRARRHGLTRRHRLLPDAAARLAGHILADDDAYLEANGFQGVARYRLGHPDQVRHDRLA